MASLTPVRVAVLSVAAAFTAPAILLACLAVGWTLWGSFAMVAGALIVLGPLMLRAIPEALEPQPYLHVLFGAWIVLCLVAAYQLAYRSAFMFDPANVQFAYDPPMRPIDEPGFERRFLPRHCCFTAYAVADELARDGRDIYKLENYRRKEGGSLPTKLHSVIGNRLGIDIYQYPPPFLLLPHALAVGHDFFQTRALWYVFNLALFLMCATALAVWAEGASFGPMWLALPIVLLAPTTQTTLQIGNVHFIIVCLALMGMLSFEQERPWLGGLLLGYAIVSKIFPGLLLAYLLVRRRWGAVTWTAGWMVVLCLGTWGLFGSGPFESFINYQLPRIHSGEAFWFSREFTQAILKNTSIEGMAWRLNELGWLGDVDPERLAGLASNLKWSHTAVLAAAAGWLGLRHGRALPGAANPADIAASDRIRLVLSWLVLIVLGQMRSPFIPWGYGNVAVLWLLAMLLPTVSTGWRLWALLGAAWLLLGINLPLPMGPLHATGDLLYSGVAVVFIWLLCLVVARSTRALMGRRVEQPRILRMMPGPG